MEDVSGRLEWEIESVRTCVKRQGDTLQAVGDMVAMPSHGVNRVRCVRVCVDVCVCSLGGNKLGAGGAECLARVLSHFPWTVLG